MAEKEGIQCLERIRQSDYYFIAEIANLKLDN